MIDLLSKGYHVGRIIEIVDDLSTMDIFSDKLIELSINKSTYYTYRHDVNNQNLNHQLELDEIEERKQYVKDNNLKVFQQWFEATRDPNYELEPIKNFFRNITFDVVSKIYPELNLNNVHYVDHFTLYENGDYIGDHTDSKNVGRLCVILIYLSNPATYNNGGGKLRIYDPKTSKCIEEVIPLRGNYALIDFTKHDIKHSVELVKNNFTRFCYINFVYNHDKC